MTVRRALGQRAFLFGLEAVAAGHIGEDRLPVEKTDDDSGPLPAAAPARCALHAVGGREVGRFALPGEGMLFAHESFSRFYRFVYVTTTIG